MNHISRRKFLKVLGGGTVAATASLMGCKGAKVGDNGNEYSHQTEPPVGKMTYRKNPRTGDNISLLGYGMMRLPNKQEGDKEVIDQEMVNKLVDYAIEHGVNYFDTSPAYCQGHSEESTGIALHHHPRDKYFVATKLSNFDPSTWSYASSVKMYHNSTFNFFD